MNALLPRLALAGLALALSSCSEPPRVSLQNTEPARELARQREQPAGSLYAGWRVFQQRCAECHGKLADGAGGAPNLLLRVRGLGPRRFVDVVLRRYSPGLLPIGEGSPRETLLDDIVERRRGDLAMPAWQGDPVVNTHVMDLYAYLNARAEGRQGPEVPVR
jgi:hypothetical protein